MEEAKREQERMKPNSASEYQRLEALFYIRGLAQRNIQRVNMVLKRANQEKICLTAAQLRVYQRTVECSKAEYSKHHQDIIALSSPAEREQQDDSFFEFVALYEEVSMAIESRLEWIRALPIQQPQPDSCQQQLVPPEEASLPPQDRNKVERSKQADPAEAKFMPGSAARVRIPASEPLTSDVSPNIADSNVPDSSSKVPESSSKVPESSTTTTNQDNFSLSGGEYVQSDKRTEKRARGDERERSASQSASSSRRGENIKTRAPALCVISFYSTTIAAASVQWSGRHRRRRTSQEWSNPRPPEAEAKVACQ
ncbi:uncharacterized protein LOC129759264 [Uranotaenia lowii]|uniref:uncharacterized protein LOC129759264 n=1 Tax=Uranotaenia lowii TaxID=190385 RepID=UPI0024791570|nr:uncharacterized protein LOC129759264 [Uranotaenia lowii]